MTSPSTLTDAISEAPAPVPPVAVRARYRLGFRIPAEYRRWVADDIGRDGYVLRQANVYFAAGIVSMLAVVAFMGAVDSRLPMWFPIINGLLPHGAFGLRTLISGEAIRAEAYVRHKVHPDGTPWPDAKLKQHWMADTSLIRWWHWALGAVVVILVTVAAVAVAF